MGSSNNFKYLMCIMGPRKKTFRGLEKTWKFVSEMGTKPVLEQQMYPKCFKFTDAFYGVQSKLTIIARKHYIRLMNLDLFS